MPNKKFKYIRSENKFYFTDKTKYTFRLITVAVIRMTSKNIKRKYLQLLISFNTCRVHLLLFCIITNRFTTNTIIVYTRTVCLCNLHCYMFRHFPVTIRQFTANVLLSYTRQTSKIVTSTNRLYKEPQINIDSTRDCNTENILFGFTNHSIVTF
jgi:hypothetical protein